MPVEYSNISDKRYDRYFGDGMVLGDFGKGFFLLFLDQQAERLGWSHSCPDVDGVIAFYAEEWQKAHPGIHKTEEELKQIGADMARKRYAECNMVYQLILDAVPENTNLHALLTDPIPRLKHEPDGNHSKKFVPPSHCEQMSFLSTPLGFALPRIVIEAMGRGPNNEERTIDRVEKAMEIVYEEAHKAHDSAFDFTARLAQRLVEEAGAKAGAVLSHLLSSEIMQEENCRSHFYNIHRALFYEAPNLYLEYEKMSATEKAKLKIVAL